MANPLRMFICAKNIFDLETCVGTASPALVSSLGMSHLKLSSRSRVARSVGAPATQTYFFTFGGAGMYMNFFSWYRHNLDPGCIWQVIGYPAADWTGAPVFDTGAVAPYSAYLLGDYGAEFGFLPLGYSQAVFYSQPRFSTVYFARVGVLSVKVIVTNTSPGIVLDVSRVFGGDGTELTYNPDSISVGWKDDGKLSAASGGGPRVDASYQYRVMSASVPWINSAQRAAIVDLQRYAGTSKDVFVSGFPSDTAEQRRDHELIGKMLEARDVELPARNPYGVYATSFKFREI